MEIVEEESIRASPRAVSIHGIFLKGPGGVGSINMSMVHSLSMETIAPLSGSHLLQDESLEESHSTGHHNDHKDSRQDSPLGATMFDDENDDHDDNDYSMKDGYDGTIECGVDAGLHHPEVAAFHRDHAGFIVSPRKRDDFSQTDPSRQNSSAMISRESIFNASATTDALDGTFSNASKLTETEEPVVLAPRFSQPLRHTHAALLEWNTSFLSSRSMSGDGTVEAGSPTSTTARVFVREVPYPSIPIQAMGSNCSWTGSFQGGGGGGDVASETRHDQNASSTTFLPTFPMTSSQRPSSARRATEKPFLCRSLAWSQDSLDERRTSKRARTEAQAESGEDRVIDASHHHDRYFGVAASYFQGEEHREETSPTLVHWEEKMVDSNCLMDRAINDKSTPSIFSGTKSPMAAPYAAGGKAAPTPPIMAAASASQYSFDSC